MKKLVFLFVALLLPVLIYLFLKSFGKNEFAVPVLFADSVTAPVACGSYAYETPYHIADSVLQKTLWNPNDSLTIYIFEEGDKAKEHERIIHRMRIFDQFKNVPLQVVHIYKDTAGKDKSAERLTTRVLPDSSFLLIRNCVFLLSPGNDAAIIDRQKRIRGQYNLTNRQDADRMIMEEMNILLKRY